MATSKAQRLENRQLECEANKNSENLSWLAMKSRFVVTQCYNRIKIPRASQNLSLQSDSTFFSSLLPDLERHFDVLPDRPEPHISSLLRRNHLVRWPKSDAEWSRRRAGVDHRLGLQHNEPDLAGQRECDVDHADCDARRWICRGWLGQQTVFDLLVNLQQLRAQHTSSDVHWIHNEAHSSQERGLGWLIQ